MKSTRPKNRLTADEMFPCERCGRCCRMAGQAPWGKGLALPTGVCRYLNQSTNLCSIYEKRPLFCNVDAFYEKYYQDSISREDFYRQNKAECERLQKGEMNRGE